MEWSNVGEWIKENTDTDTDTALVGSLLTSNKQRLITTGISIVSNATGTTDPKQALEALKQDSETGFSRLHDELAKQDATDKHEHIRLKDEQAAHAEQQKTIRAGDTAQDEYVRHTRPKIVRLAWYTFMFYIIVFELMQAYDIGDGVEWKLALLPLVVVLAYFGFRTADKLGLSFFSKKSG